MKLYCKDGVVIAWHDDGQNVPAAAYGEDVTIVDHAGSIGELGRVGEPPGEGEPDLRPYAAPS